MQEVELTAPVHLAFDELQLGDLTFGLDQGRAIAALTAALSLTTPLAKEAIRLDLARSSHGSRSAGDRPADHDLKGGDEVAGFDKHRAAHSPTTRRHPRQPCCLSRCHSSAPLWTPADHCHRDLHGYGDEASWWAGIGIDPLPIALELWWRSRFLYTSEATLSEPLSEVIPPPAAKVEQVSLDDDAGDRIE